MNLLDYENQIFLEAIHEDGLLIMARGLGLERIFATFLRAYSDSANLVLVLNATASDEQFFINKLKTESSDDTPLKCITTQYSAAERNAIYLQGGVMFVTSRILVVDMLTKKIPTDLITGILVYNAHKVLESCQEAFILRLYRQSNKKGFIKAFSDSPMSFTAGFCHVERVMKSLFVRNLYLWPRFSPSVMACMEARKVDVVELYVSLTSAMVACQTSLLELLDGCVKEIKRCNSALDTDEVTVENALTRDFERVVKLHLEPVWHQLSGKTRQLVNDIKTLRQLLEYLTQHDAVTFYSLVHSIRSSEAMFGANTGWLFMDAADTLFVHAKERVYGGHGNKKAKDKSANGKAVGKKTADTTDDDVQPECFPKWQALLDALEEIKQHSVAMETENAAPEGASKILIVARDDETCVQLRLLLSMGEEPLLQYLFKKLILRQKVSDTREKVKNGESAATAKKKAKKRKFDLEDGDDSNTDTLTQMLRRRQALETESSSAAEDSEATATDAEGGGRDGSEVTGLSTVVHSLRGGDTHHALLQTLYDLKPRFVILYDPDVTFVRQIEVYRACYVNLPLRVYYIVYKSSVEEQRYLTSLRREQQAFEYLFSQKETMVVPVYQDGKTEDCPELSRDMATPQKQKFGKKRKEPKPQPRVIVDMREFRSELPALVHRRGIDIEPVTLEVGDYVLTPDICVERKSVSDLIQSLNSGRLYNQCVAMCQHYHRPVLLIEFDPNKPFSLQGKYMMSHNISTNDVTSRLSLLTLHFPNLRIVWCQSPYASAELFEDLKANADEPDTAKALAATSDTTDTEISTDKYNFTSKNMLLKMPGINTKNVSAVMNAVENLVELSTLSLERLTEILENGQHAKSLFDFIHSDERKAMPTKASKLKTKLAAIKQQK